MELKKGPWTREEDQKLLSYIQQHGHGTWRSLPPKAGLERCGKSCRLRWTNYLRPDIKRGKFSPNEEKAVIRLHALLGNRWSAIAAHLPKRTDNEIKNYWNTRLKKRLTRMGIDPATHKPKTNGSAQSRHYADLSHMAQWETARLEAESRLACASKIHLLGGYTAAAGPPPRPTFPCLDVLKAWQANTGTLELPNFSCSNGATVSSLMANGAVSVNNYGYGYGYVGARGTEQAVIMDRNADKEKGEMEISSQVHNNSLAAFHVECCSDYNGVTGALDLADAADRDYEGYNMTGGDTAGEFEDIKNYWNELLMVTGNYTKKF